MRSVILALVLGTVLVSCTRSDPAELLETAKFEELQRNVPHARELYERIVADHPQSEEAKVARERLAALDETP